MLSISLTVSFQSPQGIDVILMALFRYLLFFSSQKHSKYSSQFNYDQHILRGKVTDHNKNTQGLYICPMIKKNSHLRFERFKAVKFCFYGYPWNEQSTYQTFKTYILCNSQYTYKLYICYIVLLIQYKPYIIHVYVYRFVCQCIYHTLQII